MISLWVDSGARYEKLTEAGVTHLIQRMALHGAGDRSAKLVAKAIDRLGGDFQMEAQRDTAVYQVRVSPDNIKAAAELIADVSLRPNLTQAALTAESDNLIEDLLALEKDADFVLEGMFLRSLWKGHGLCRAPRGRLLMMKGNTKLEAFKPNKIQTFHTHSHHPEALTLVAAGDVRHDAMEKLAERLFGSLEPPKTRASTITPNAYKFLALRNRAEFPKVRFEIGFPACAAADDQRHEAALLNAAIAGSSGSRLARLASKGDLPTLAVASRLQMFEDVGCLSIRGRAAPKDAEQAIERVVAELWRIADTPLGADELERARTTRKTALLGEVDSLPNRVAGLARAERYFKRLLSWEEEFTAIEEVTPKDVQRLASLWINPYQLSMAVLGDLTGLNIGGHLLKRR